MFKETYIKDVIERKNIRNKTEFEQLLDIMASNIGCLTSARKLALSFKSIANNSISEPTLSQYLEYISEAFLVNKVQRKQLEVDFVANIGSKRYYIQSAQEIPTQEKQEQEKRSLLEIKDSFRKVIIIEKDIVPRHDENGITILGMKDFLLNMDSLDF